MEVTVETDRERHVYRLYDKTDTVTGFSSMARTTGYTATAAARLVLSGAFNRPGICPPEYIGATRGCFERILADLAARGVTIDGRKEPL